MRMFLALSLASTLIAGLPPALPALPVIAPAAVLEPNAALAALLARQHVIELPSERLKCNWVSPHGQGSCMHASLRHLLQWQGAHDLAARWEHYSGGVTFPGLAAKLNAAGIDWAEARPGDEHFLELACAARRGAVVTFGRAHAVSLVGLDARAAYVLDPNSPAHTQRIARDTFLADWHSRGGFALTPLAGPPAAPVPWSVTPRKVHQ